MGVKKQSRRPRGRGGAYPPGCALHPHGPLVAPLTYFFLLYISIYPANIQEHHETQFPLPQPSVPKRSHLGAFSGALPEGALITEDLECKSRSNRGGQEIGGRAHPYRARPLSCGPLGWPSIYFFLLYKPTYPKNIQGATKEIFPPS